MSNRNFGFLGSDFEITLVKTLIEDTKFALNIIDYIDYKFIENKYTRHIFKLAQEFYNDFGVIPTFDTIEKRIIETHKNKKEIPKILLDTFNNIRNPETSIDSLYVKKIAMNFCKQQVLKEGMKKINDIIDNGSFGEYDQIESILMESLSIGEDKSELADPFDNIREIISKDTRTPIPTGIDGLDRVLKGGLSHGELGVLIAPTGIGKTTLLTKFANTGFNENFKVLQIIFEDTVASIKRKHYTIWSEISPNEHIDRVDEVEQKVIEKRNLSNGELHILKLPSDSMTVSKLKSKLKHFRSEGVSYDLLIIDYVDCIVGEKTVFGEEWKGEGSIMRSIEAMAEEFNIATWVATQGNRDSIKNELVTSDQVGGSIKKIAVAHVVISVGKSLEQKEQKMATMSILKSRIGGDGIVYQNCGFDNEYIKITTEEQRTFIGFKENKAEENRRRAATAYANRQNQTDGDDQEGNNN